MQEDWFKKQFACSASFAPVSMYHPGMIDNE